MAQYPSFLSFWPVGTLFSPDLSAALVACRGSSYVADSPHLGERAVSDDEPSRAVLNYADEARLATTFAERKSDTVFAGIGWMIARLARPEALARIR
jgi:hypothetical protein